MNTVSEAVILMAGLGSRLRLTPDDTLKPLVLLKGRPLISYTLDALRQSQVQRITAILGFEAEVLGRALTELVPDGVHLRIVHNPHWRKQNGISLLAAAETVDRPFLLTMSDHVFDSAILQRLLKVDASSVLHLAIDRKVNAIFDVEDATKVQTSGEGLSAIGKNLDRFDAIDTGLFACPPSIFSYLERAAKDSGDCSLTDAVRLMAKDGKVRCLDIGDAWWQDIDNPAMLKHAGELIERANLVAAATR